MEEKLAWVNQRHIRAQIADRNEKIYYFNSRPVAEAVVFRRRFLLQNAVNRRPGFWGTHRQRALPAEPDNQWRGSQKWCCRTHLFENRQHMHSARRMTRNRNLFFQPECTKTVTNLWRNEFPPEVCVKYNLFARTRLPNLNSEFLIKRVAKRKRRTACALLLDLISDLLLLLGH